MKKYSYYVALIESNNHIKYVTEINNATKVARWEAGKPAMKFTKSAAENLVFGLTANCFPAVILQAPSFHEFSNSEEGD